MLNNDTLNEIEATALAEIAERDRVWNASNLGRIRRTWEDYTRVMTPERARDLVGLVKKLREMHRPVNYWKVSGVLSCASCTEYDGAGGFEPADWPCATAYVMMQATER